MSPGRSTPSAFTIGSHRAAGATAIAIASNVTSLGYEKKYSKQGSVAVLANMLPNSRV